MPARRTELAPTPLATPPPSPDGEVVVSRIIDAPRELVFHAWTRSVHLRRWLGPQSSIDFRVGGAFHASLGGEAWFRGVHREIVPHERLVYDDAALTVTFTAHAGRTTVTVRHADDAADWHTPLERLAAVMARM
jgi:uncharacterized protein YndB with AHSA1/START domain